VDSWNVFLLELLPGYLHFHLNTVNAGNTATHCLNYDGADDSKFKELIAGYLWKG
jgi:hypothetical protein